MSGQETIERIISDLEIASESLNDIAMSLIHDALERGTGERPAREKRVSQARRAVDKALQILKGSDFNTD